MRIDIFFLTAGCQLEPPPRLVLKVGGTTTFLAGVPVKLKSNHFKVPSVGDYSFASTPGGFKLARPSCLCKLILLRAGQQCSTPWCGAGVHQEQYPISPHPVHYEQQIVGGAGGACPGRGGWEPRNLDQDLVTRGCLFAHRCSPAATRHLAARRGHVNKIV